MALLKANINPYNGEQVQNYIKITEICISLINKDTSYINYVVYLNQKARQDGLTPIDSWSIRLTPEQFDTVFGLDVFDGNTNPVKQAYEFLKSLEQFTDTQDA